jgi:hypothetical protein
MKLQDMLMSLIDQAEIRNLPEGRLPQEQVSPWTGLFSETARSQVH